MLFKTIGTIIIFFTICCIGGCNTTENQYIKNQNGYVEQIDAKTLIEYYNDNEIRVHVKYIDEIFIIDGTVTDIDEGLFLGTLIIELNHDIICSFNKSEKHEIMNISKGDRIHVRGIVDCKIIWIYLSNCRIM